jgi:hypothetical protein
MTGKMEHIPAINTNPLDNSFCNKMSCTDLVCKNCYSRAMLKGIRRHCGPVWSENGKVLSNRILTEEELPILNVIWLRFSGHGELINKVHFLNLCAIARVNPRVKCVLWTKRSRIVRENIDMVPSNLTLIYSNPRVDHVMKLPPKGFDRVFNVVSKDSYKSNCAGLKCWDCGKCYDSDTICLIERLRVSKNGASPLRKN